MFIKKIRFLLCVAAVSSICSVSFARAEGHESGGGGGIIIGAANNPMLVDFENLKVSRQEIEEVFTDIESLRIDSEITLTHKDFNNSSNVVYGTASQLMSLWIDGFYGRLNVSPSKLIFRSMKWTYTKSMQFTQSHYRPQSLDEKKQIYTAAYFYKSKPLNEVKISIGIWNQMHSVDQIGLIVHEMLRNYQLGFGQNINDEVLQKATSMMIYCKPVLSNTSYLLSLITADQSKRLTLLQQYNSKIKTCRN